MEFVDKSNVKVDNSHAVVIKQTCEQGALEQGRAYTETRNLVAYMREDTRDVNIVNGIMSAIVHTIIEGIRAEGASDYQIGAIPDFLKEAGQLVINAFAKRNMDIGLAIEELYDTERARKHDEAMDKLNKLKDSIGDIKF
jgi:hypothetical protein